jgi:hypothetical protein
MNSRQSLSRSSSQASASRLDFKNKKQTISRSSSPMIARTFSETRYGTSSEEKTSTQKFGKKSARHLHFRETLRKLLNTNEGVFGKRISSNEGQELIRQH